MREPLVRRNVIMVCEQSTRSPFARGLLHDQPPDGLRVGNRLSELVQEKGVGFDGNAALKRRRKGPGDFTIPCPGVDKEFSTGNFRLRLVTSVWRSFLIGVSRML